jgi:hypothetical protein
MKKHSPRQAVTEICVNCKRSRHQISFFRDQGKKATPCHYLEISMTQGIKSARIKNLRNIHFAEKLIAFKLNPFSDSHDFCNSTNISGTAPFFIRATSSGFHVCGTFH